MFIESNASLQALNSFGIVARAQTLVHLQQTEDLLAVLADPEMAQAPKFVLGGGSNIVLTGDVKAVVLKVEIKGHQLVEETAKHWIVEAGAGENWHEFVLWTLAQGYPGLENLALIPGTVGAAPVQNIGAYGVELQDRFDSLEAVDLHTGKVFRLNAAQCAFGYRDSVFKHSSDFGLAGKALITRVRFALPKRWQPVLGYVDLEKKMTETGLRQPTAQDIADWVCGIRRAKLPDPQVIGNAGSFFKNPAVEPGQAAALRAWAAARGLQLRTYPADGGKEKIPAAWLIEQAGFPKGYAMGAAGISSRHTLALINRGGARAAEILALAERIKAGVAERFGIALVMEPVRLGF